MVVVYELTLGKHLGAHEEFKTRLADRVYIRQESILTICDIILALCTITSRVGTDVEAAINKIPEGKAVILVVFHQSFDPNHVVTDSRRFITRENVVLADIVFDETNGLHRCLQNDEALKKVTDHLIGLGAEIPQRPELPKEGKRVWLSFGAILGTIVLVVIILGILKGTHVI